jgi:hypothetical protein
MGKLDRPLHCDGVAALYLADSAAATELLQQRVLLGVIEWQQTGDRIDQLYLP